MTEPEIHAESQFLLRSHPFTGKRANYNDKQADKKEIDAQPLPARFIAGNRRCHEQARGQPGGGNPKNPKLGVPGAGHGIGQPFAQWNSVEAVALHAVMRGDGAQPHLYHDEGRHDPEIFQDRLHGRRCLEREQRVGLWHVPRFFGVLMPLHGKIPHHGTDSREQHHKADHRPDND